MTVGNGMQVRLKGDLLLCNNTDQATRPCGSDAITLINLLPQLAKALWSIHLVATSRFWPNLNII